MSAYAHSGHRAQTSNFGRAHASRVAINLSPAVRNSAATLCSDNDPEDMGMGGRHRPD
jgi:hypothetical protein